MPISTNINYECVLYRHYIYLYMIILSMHLFPQMVVMLGFMCMVHSIYKNARKAKKYEVKNPCPQWDSNPQPLN